MTNVNFKNLTEQLGFRGRQEHYDAYVEDFVIRQQEDGSEVVEFREGPTKARSGGLTISRRTTPQAMYSTDGGKTDPVRLFKLWLSKRPDGMKDKGPLYLSVINRPKSNDIWYTKIRMGENTIGNIMKSMASCLKTNKKLTNHSMRKTLVSKLKKSGQPRNVICEITGHARESSLDDYDEIDENQRKELSHIISGFKVVPNENGPNDVSNQNSTAAKAPTIQNTVQQPVLHQRAPLVPINRVQQQGQMHQAMEFLNPDFQAAGFEGFPPSCPPVSVPHGSVRFGNHAYDFKPNCTPLSSITIINHSFLSTSLILTHGKEIVPILASNGKNNQTSNLQFLNTQNGMVFAFDGT